jgi:hypothetical protein
MSNYYGLPTGILESKYLRLEYLTRAGLRIVRLSLNGGPNLLAELPDFYTETPLGNYLFRGGHRLWRSPELMPETYIPEKDDLVVEKAGEGARLSQPPLAGISRSIEVQLSQERAAITLIHHLHNESTKSVTLAPWALTMFPLGGVAIMPQPVEYIDRGGYIPNRVLVFWPFSRVQDPRLTLGDEYILLQAQPGLPAIKLGTFNPHGWLGYVMHGIMFIKRFEPFQDANFPDWGCNAELYCNDRFIELESLGPLKDLGPGESVLHKETWEIYENLDQPFIPADLRKKIVDLH